MSLSGLEGPALVLGLTAGWFITSRLARESLSAASTVLEASIREARVSANMKALVTGVNELEATVDTRMTRLAEVVDALDGNQGAILSGLINSGVMRFAEGHARPEEVGERPFKSPMSPPRVPPLTEEQEEPALR